MKNVCVICDKDKEYAAAFIEYFNSKKTLSFRAIACSGKESLIKYALENPIDILLVAESTMDEDIGDIPAVVTIVLGEGLKKQECEGYKQVYKFQSCDEVIRSVMEDFSEKQEAIQEFGPLNRQKKEVIGVYSPCGGCAKTSFALALGSMISENKKVLFVDMTLFSGLDQMLDLDTGRGLSDLLYYCGEGKKNINAKIAGMTCERLGMDMIPPLTLAEDLTGITPDRWKMLFEMLSEKGVYDVLILDIGIPSFGILDYCTKIYLPVKDGSVSKKKVQSFLSSLKKSRYREIEQRISMVKVPEERVCEADNIFESAEFERIKAWTIKNVGEETVIHE